MIISHRHRFIFIKTLKTAGTSIEVALARHCGPEDIITRIEPPVPEHRHQNDEGFYNHMSAARIKAALPASVWDGYYKLAFERNPWDKLVSWYWFLKRKYNYSDSFRDFCVKGFLSGPDDLRDDFGVTAKVGAWLWWGMHQPYPDLGLLGLLRRRLGGTEDFQGFPMDFDRYSIDGRIAVDTVGRYEDLGGEFRRICTRIGLPDDLELPVEKGSTRRDATPYCSYYDDHLAELVARRFRREIAAFGYRLTGVGDGGPQIV
jgi:hypothetical protein